MWVSEPLCLAVYCTRTVDTYYYSILWSCTPTPHLTAWSKDGLPNVHFSQLLLCLIEGGVEECWMHYHTLDVSCMGKEQEVES